MGEESQTRPAAASVTWPQLVRVLLGICTAAAVLVGAAFSWHKEQPHEGVPVAIAKLETHLGSIQKQLDRIEEKIP